MFDFGLWLAADGWRIRRKKNHFEFNLPFIFSIALDSLRTTSVNPIKNSLRFFRWCQTYRKNFTFFKPLIFAFLFTFIVSRIKYSKYVEILFVIKSNACKKWNKTEKKNERPFEWNSSSSIIIVKFILIEMDFWTNSKKKNVHFM